MDFATRVASCATSKTRSQKHAVTNAMAQRPIFLLLALVAPSAGRPYHDDRKTKHGHTCACRLLRARPLRRAPARL